MTSLISRPRLATFATLTFLAGCPSSEENPRTLWLNLDGRETEVKLVDFEPPPF
jgi:hypothetical protein